MMERVKKIQRLIGRKKVLVNEEVLNTEMDRCLSTSDVVFFGFGHTVGAGMYVLTGIIAKNIAGPGVVLSFLIAGLAALFSGICYAELGSRIPKAGSAYAYSIIVVGELWGFFVGWNMILENTIGCASVARSLSGSPKISFLSDYLDFLAGFLTIFIAIILLIRVKDSSIINKVLSTINIITIVTVIVVGFYYADIKLWTSPTYGSFLPYGFTGVIQGASNAFYGFVGFENVACAAEETKIPTYTMPRALISVLMAALFTYMAVSSILTLMVPYYAIDLSYSIANAFQLHNCFWARYLVTVGGISAMVGCILCNIFGASRLIYSMASDGLFFRCFSYVTPTSKIPICSVMLSTLTIVITTVMFDLEILMELLSIGTLTAYTMVGICVILLRYDDNFPRSEYCILDDLNADGDVQKVKPKLRSPFKSCTNLWPFSGSKSSVIRIALILLAGSSIAIIQIAKIIFSHATNWWICFLMFIFCAIFVVSFIIISAYNQTEQPGEFFKVCIIFEQDSLCMSL
ncbi:Cationic amino acid transporter 4 [Nymphon striatum]|nr:Cationic amino acid transporter 4 [Nymphon striatum]